MWGLKIGIPAHFILRAQSPGRGALSSGTLNKSSLKAQGCGRGRLYAWHLAKRPKKRTDSAQGQHRGKGCHHLNVEPIAWQAHTRTMLSSSSPTTLTWGLIRRVTTPNKEKLTRMWRTGENTSIKGGRVSLWRGGCLPGNILIDPVTHEGGDETLLGLSPRRQTFETPSM